MTDDDAKDLSIHRSIERLISVYMMRGWTREKVIAEMCSGNDVFLHGYEAICEQQKITRAELNERISAFIEAEREEQAERAARAIAEACRAEEGVL